MDALLRELRDLLVQRSLQRREVTLASGRKSNFYLDCKQTSLHARGMWLCGRLLFERLPQPMVPAVAGVTLGGDPLVCAVALEAHARGVPLDAVIVRKQTKGHGTGAMLEGAAHLAKGSELVLLEDVVTTGGSALAALEQIRAAGMRCSRVLALVDRLEGGREAIEAAGVALDVLLVKGDLGV